MKFQVLFCIAFAFFLTKTNGIAIEKSITTKEFQSAVTGLTLEDYGLLKKIPDGYCHWERDVWHKPGDSLQCNCLKCTCAGKGKWNCEYSFEYCPYRYCNKIQYNPKVKKCCCRNLKKRSIGFIFDGGNIRATHACWLLPLNQFHHAAGPFTNCPGVTPFYPF